MTHVKNVSLVSDYLGTPIHAQGIFNFTFRLVHLLKRLDIKVTLLVVPPTIGFVKTVLRERKDRFLPVSKSCALMSVV